MKKVREIKKTVVLYGETNGYIACCNADTGNGNGNK